MKIKFVMSCLMSCCVLMMALPLNAFALQAINIPFERLDQEDQLRKGRLSPPTFVGGRSFLEVGGVMAVGNACNDFDEQCSQGNSLALIALGGNASKPFIDGVGGQASASALLVGASKTIIPVGVKAFVPNHCVSVGTWGRCSWENQQNAGAAGSEICAVGISDACYATCGGGVTPNNKYATMDVFLHFIANGTCEFLDIFSGSVENRLPGTEHRVCNFVVDEDFSQRILVGDTDVTNFHFGNGVIMTTGQLAASTEKSLANFTRQVNMIEGCGVNHFWRARQRVLINSGSDKEVDVQMCTELAISCRRGIPVAGPGTSNYTWTAVSSAFFFARDYCLDESVLFDEDGNPVDSDGNPIPDAGGNGNGNGNGNLPFCNPLKVLINDGLGALGTVELDGTDQAIDDSRQATAFSDLETLTVQVAPGSPFLCNLIINDAETGELVADFNPADATYDAATGMAVFDLSSVGPFAPGVYDVQVGTLYQADVYVAIPGDVNLDGVVNDADSRIDANGDGELDADELFTLVQHRSALLGDVNRDGAVNFLDLSAFIAVLSAGEFQIEADVNQDGVVNFLDIAPFISLLTSPS